MSHRPTLPATAAGLGLRRALLGALQSAAPGDFDAQARLAFANLERALRAGGSSLRNVVKVTIFLTDMAHFPRIVELRGEYFSPPYPADTIIEVSRLYHEDAMIEIEAIAVSDAAAEREV